MVRLLLIVYKHILFLIQDEKLLFWNESLEPGLHRVLLGTKLFIYGNLGSNPNKSKSKKVIDHFQVVSVQGLMRKKKKYLFPIFSLLPTSPFFLSLPQLLGICPPMLLRKVPDIKKIYVSII